MADPLDALRALMASHSPPLDALVVPSEDNHQVLRPSLPRVPPLDRGGIVDRLSLGFISASDLAEFRISIDLLGGWIGSVFCRV